MQTWISRNFRIPGAHENTQYRRHTDSSGGYDQNEIKRYKALNYFKQNCPISIRFAIQTFLRVYPRLNSSECLIKTFTLENKSQQRT